MDPRIDDILARLQKLENRVPTDLARILSGLQNIGDVPKIAGGPVTSSPTANGYVPFIINGKRINLLSGS